MNVNAAKEAIAFLAREGSVQSLAEVNRFTSVKRCLFKPDSVLWKTNHLRDDLLRLIRKGREDLVIYRNVRDLFQLFAQGLRGDIEMVSREDIVGILADREFVECMWETVVSRGIQYRMLVAYIRARDSLIQNRISASVMPLTAEMQLRLEEEAQRHSPQVDGGSEH